MQLLLQRSWFVSYIGFGLQKQCRASDSWIGPICSNLTVKTSLFEFLTKQFFYINTSSFRKPFNTGSGTGDRLQSHISPAGIFNSPIIRKFGVWHPTPSKATPNSEFLDSSTRSQKWSKDASIILCVLVVAKIGYMPQVEREWYSLVRLRRSYFLQKGLILLSANTIYASAGSKRST